MKIVYVFLEFLSNKLELMENLSRKNVNKHYKRLVRIFRKLSDHLKTEMTWESLSRFQYEFSPNKAKYGQKIRTPLSEETLGVLNLIVEESKVHMIEFQKKGMALELHIMGFVKNSCQSVISGTFCTDQKELLSQLITPSGPLAASA